MSATAPAETGLFKMRTGQRAFFRGVQDHRISGFLCRRQYGKTSTAALIALKKMAKKAGHTVVFGSVKLDLGREIVRKEAEAMHKAVAAIAKGGEQFQVVDPSTGKRVDQVGADDWADLYEHARLEFRLHHSRSIYSRTKVVALTPDAVGETGDLILDEVGRVKNFRAVWEAVKPIIASNPQFRCILTTTPPPDDSHYSFELLSPPVGTEFTVRPEGNEYRSELGVWVLRVDAWDAHADGVPLYDDDTGEPIDPATARAKESDKEAWDRNYGVKFVMGGTAAVGLLQLNSAQQRGMGRCACFVIETDADFCEAMAWLRSDRVGLGPLAVGADLATTEKESSNPTAVTVMERSGAEVIALLTLVWKTRDPAVAKDRFHSLLATLREIRPGNPPRRMAIDATSERYFATELQRELAPMIPVELVVASETVEQPGSESITKKALLGNQYVQVLDDNRAVLAPERYIRDDHRLVKRDRGTFVTDIGTAGEHGDTFDSHKLALHALTSTAGAIDSMTGIRVPKPALHRRGLALHRRLH